MTTIIRITSTEVRAKGGFAGALAGGTEPGAMNEVSIETEYIDNADIIPQTMAAAEAYRLAFLGERSAEGFIDAEILDDTTNDLEGF